MNINFNNFKARLLPLILLVFALGFIFYGSGLINSESQAANSSLPKIETEAGLAEVIYQRRSEREFSKNPLSKEEIAYLLWAGEGINIDGVSGPTRTSPSAGATNPLEIYLLAARVDGLEPGIYRYNTADHELELKREGDKGTELARAALGQRALEQAPAVLIVAANYERTTARYGERGIRYVQIEAGHAGQNISLMAEEQGLGSVIIGAFDDQEILEKLEIESAEPLLLIPVGEKYQE